VTEQSDRGNLVSLSVWPEGFGNSSGIDHDQGSAGVADLHEHNIQQCPVAQLELQRTSLSSLFEGLNRSAQEGIHLVVDSDREG